MNDAPTLIVYARDNWTASTRNDALPTTACTPNEVDSAALQTLTQALTTGLPIRFVAKQQLADKAKALLTSSDIVELDGAGLQGSSTYIRRGPVAAGVMASAQSAGWLLVPADMPQIKTETLHRLCIAMREHPLVYPTHDGRQGRSLGFSSEFFSELIRVNQEQDLSRLLARYPSVGITMDDPGLLSYAPDPLMSGVPVKSVAMPPVRTTLPIRFHR